MPYFDYTKGLPIEYFFYCKIAVALEIRIYFIMDNIRTLCCGCISSDTTLLNTPAHQDYRTLEHQNRGFKRKYPSIENQSTITFKEPINQRKVIKTQAGMANNKLVDSLTNLETIMHYNIKHLEDTLNAFIADKLVYNIDTYIKNIKELLNKKTNIKPKIETTLYTFNMIRNYLTEVTTIITDHVLVSQEINDILVDCPRKKEIEAKIIDVNQVYTKNQQFLITIFKDLNTMVITSMETIGSIDFTNKTATEAKPKYDIIFLKKLFDMSLVFEQKLTAIAKTASNNKQLDMLVTSYQNKTISSSVDATNTVAINDFLDHNKNKTYDALINVISNMISLNKKIGIIYNSCLGLICTRSNRIA
jgi:hypothetical protein